MTPDRKDTNPLTGYCPPLLRPKSKLRWIVFVAMNLTAFVAGNAFWAYLHRGTFEDISAAGIRRDLLQPCGQVLLEPLNIFTHPWMILISALLLAMLVLVPLAMAVLYQLLLALLFVVVVAVVGHAPLLALALAIGCLLAARTRLRRDYPVMAILIGMAPVALYLYALDYLAMDVGAYMPIQRWILAVPFLLGLLLAMAVAPLLVGMARLTRFQPGVIWPALVLLFPTALSLFYAKVGPAELEYALLTRPLHASTGLFESNGKEAWAEKHHLDGIADETLLGRARDQMESRLARLRSACDQFIARYPESPRARELAWVRAEYSSTRINRRDWQVGWITYTTAFTSTTSAEEWQELADAWPDSSQAALADWVLARLALRSLFGLPAEQITPKAREVYERLRDARDRLAVAVEAFDETEPADAVFGHPPQMPPVEAYRQALFQVEQTVWVFEQNRVLEDPKAIEALSALARTNPVDPDYDEILESLAANPLYQKTSMAGLLKLAVALRKPSLRERAAALKPIADNPLDKASIPAHYELGEVLLQSATDPDLRTDLGLRTAEEYFKNVVWAISNPWQPRAMDYLERLLIRSGPQ